MSSNSSSEYKVVADQIVSPDPDIILKISGDLYKGSITEDNRYATMADVGEGGGSGSADIADFTFEQTDEDETTMSLHDKDMTLRTTRSGAGVDADINIRSADDVFITAEGDAIELNATGNVSISVGDGAHAWEFATNGVTNIPGEVVGSPNNNITLTALNVDERPTALLSLDQNNERASLKARDWRQSSFTSSDWATGVWAVSPAQIVLTTAPNVISMYESDFGQSPELYVSINNGEDILASGASYGGGDITIDIATSPEAAVEVTITDLVFKYARESKVEIDYDDDELNIVGRSLDVGITSTRGITVESNDDLRVTSTGDDIVIDAADDIFFYANSQTSQYQWRMNSAGQLVLPADGYITNPPTSSGDGNGYSTIQIVTDTTRYDTNQYLIVDTTAPKQIHIRAGGTQDASSADLIVGAEETNVKVSDTDKQVVVSAYDSDTSTQHAWTFGNDGVLYGPNAGLKLDGGVSGSFTSADNKTITVTNGIITAITPL